MAAGFGVAASVFHYRLLDHVGGDRELSAGPSDPSRGGRQSSAEASNLIGCAAHNRCTAVFIWHTAEDPYVPVEHAYRLAASLAAHGVSHAVHVFAHGPHSLGLAIGAGEPAAWTELAKLWIQEQTEVD